MRWISLLFVASILSFPAKAETLSEQLTANDLAQILNMYWWNVEIPSDLGPNDSVSVILVNFHGKQIGAGVSLRPGPSGSSLGSLVHVFCREDKTARQTIIGLQVNGGAITCGVRDYFRGGAYSSFAIGATLKPNENLMKFDVSKKIKAPFKSDDRLVPGELGLQLVIRKG